MEKEKFNEALKEEERKLKRLRTLVAIAINIIRQADLSIEDAYRIVEGVRREALKLFPEKGDTFDLIYGSRFKRVIMEKFKLH
ncbi:MAG: hypothetical protein QW561_04750 [Candidatus Aenigmatarchaeota archaeon]